MISLLRDLIMIDETPTGDKAVYVFLEMIALGFVLYAIEEAFKENASWIKVGVASALGIVFFLLGVYWTKLKVRVRSSWAHRIDVVANDYRYRYGLAVLLVGVSAVYIAKSLYSLRSDLETYVMPRRITDRQSLRLREYLSHRNSFGLGVKIANMNDPESLDYASEIFTALRNARLEVNPPRHDGPGPVKLHEYMPRPHKTDKSATGSLLYKNDDSFITAQDAWIDSEIARIIDQRNFPATGLTIIEVIPDSAPTNNADPSHSTRAMILHDALVYAGIENSGSGLANGNEGELYLLVGRRPMVLGDKPPILSRIGRWIERLGIGAITVIPIKGGQ
jgi:hypothetical protein